MLRRSFGARAAGDDRELPDASNGRGGVADYRKATTRVFDDSALGTRRRTSIMVVWASRAIVPAELSSNLLPVLRVTPASGVASRRRNSIRLAIAFALGDGLCVAVAEIRLVVGRPSIWADAVQSSACGPGFQFRPRARAWIPLTSTHVS